MARPKKEKNPEETIEEAPASPETTEPTPVKAKRGRPKQKKEKTKSKSSNKDKVSKLQKTSKSVTVEVPSEMINLIPGEALIHFTNAIKSFLLGFRSLVDKNLDMIGEKRTRKAPGKRPQKIKVED